MAWYDRILGIDRRLAQAEKAGYTGAVVNLNEAEIDYPDEFGMPYARSDQDVLGRPWLYATTPAEWTYTQRKAILLRVHQAWERNPLAKQCVGLIRKFVVGQGLQLSYHSAVTERVLEDWRRRNAALWEDWEKQLFDQLLIDGEVFIRVYTNGIRSEEFADVRAVPIKPWLVEAIETDPDDYTARRAYWIIPEKGSGRQGDKLAAIGTAVPVRADEVIHATINRLAYDMRGRSELYSILPWLNAYKGWLENRARINRYKGVLYHLKLSGGTGSDVQSKRNTVKKPLEPASIYVSTDKEELKELGGHVGADNAAEDGRAIKLMAIVGMGLPEYMMAEGQNANLATARSQQLPALRSFLDYQDVYINTVWRPLYMRILEATLGADRTVPETDENGRDTGRDIRLEDSFTLAAPDIMEEDPKTLAEALEIAVTNEWVSARTASTRMGFDYTKEKEIIDAERQAVTPAPPKFGGEPEEGEPEGVESAV